MARLALLLTTGPFQFQNWETVSNLAEAALDKGHQVDIFCYLDGVYNSNRYQTFPDLPEMPKDRFIRLVDKGANIVNCGICVNARGLQNGKDYIEGVHVGGLPDFAEMVGQADALVTF